MTSEPTPGEAPEVPQAGPPTDTSADIETAAEAPSSAAEAAGSDATPAETAADTADASAAVAAEAAPPQSPPVPTRPWARRTFVLRTLGAIGAGLAAVVAIPVAGLASAPASKSPLRWSLLAGSVAPTPRSTGFVNLGPLTNFPVGGAPTLLPVTVPVEIGGVAQDAQIAVYVARPHDQSVVILDIHCTHMGCPVGWSVGAKRFLCPCHGGAFTADGHQESGPPPRPLDRYQAIIANQEVWMGPLIEGA